MRPGFRCRKKSFPNGYDAATKLLRLQRRITRRSERGHRGSLLDRWRPFTNSIEHWAPDCQIVCDKLRVLSHAKKAIDEVRRPEFFRKGRQRRKVTCFRADSLSITSSPPGAAAPTDASIGSINARPFVVYVKNARLLLRYDHSNASGPRTFHTSRAHSAHFVRVSIAGDNRRVSVLGPGDGHGDDSGKGRARR
jgi:hypothetical protein